MTWLSRLARTKVNGLSIGAVGKTVASRAVWVLLSALCQVPGVVLATDSTQDRARANATAAVWATIDATEPEPGGEDDQFALGNAVVAGDVEEAERLLAAGADPNSAPPLPSTQEIGPTPLWVAAAKGDTDMVEALLRAKADPDRMWYYGTAMAAAASQGHGKVVDLLIDAGADIGLSPPGAIGLGMIPLLLAVRQGHVDAASRLIDAGAYPCRTKQSLVLGEMAIRRTLLRLESGDGAIAALLRRAARDCGD